MCEYKLNEYEMDEYEMDVYEMNNGLEYSTFQTFLFRSGNMNMYVHLCHSSALERHNLLKSISEQTRITWLYII